MEKAINSQSKNEVKELLDEYVVSPINSDISNILKNLSNEIESTKEDIGKIFSSVKCNISNLENLLDKSFHFENEEDVFVNLSDTIENSQEVIIEKIDENKKELSEIITEITPSFTYNIMELKGFLDKNFHFEKGEDELEKISNTIVSSQEAIVKKIDEEKKELTNTVTEITPSVNNNIIELKSLLDKTFHFDDEEDELKKLSDTIEINQEIINEKINENQKKLSDNYTEILNNLGKLINDFQEIDKRLKDDLTKYNQELSESITEHFTTLGELINKQQTASEICISDIKSGLSNLQGSLSKEIKALQLQMKELYMQSEKHFTDNQDSLILKIQEIENLIIQNNEGLTENINTKIQVFTDNYTEQSTALCNSHSEAKDAINIMESQQQIFIEQRYKKLFKVSLFFGVGNALGLITMILLYVFK